MIECGWCGHPARPPRCDYCGRNPLIPWEHRDMQPPATGVQDAPGRPSLEAEEVRRAYAQAVADLRASSRPVTIEAIAERLDRSPRTVREWRQRFSLK